MWLQTCDSGKSSAVLMESREKLHFADDTEEKEYIL